MTALTGLSPLSRGGEEILGPGQRIVSEGRCTTGRLQQSEGETIWGLQDMTEGKE